MRRNIGKTKIVSPISATMKFGKQNFTENKALRYKFYNWNKHESFIEN